MEPLTAANIRGVWGTLLLPILDDDSIDWKRLEHQLDALLRSGVSGVYAHGTAGEFHALGESEFRRINELLAEACTAAQVPFQIGASHPGAQACLDRLRSARDLAPGAIQVILPDWLPLSADECVAFLERVSREAAPVPMVLYNPPHAKTQLTPEIVGHLLDGVPNLAGIKVAGGDDEWFAAMLPHRPRCALFVAGHTLASGVARGAHGSYSNIAAMSPAGAVAWYRLMQRDMPAALDVERRIGEFFAAHVAPLQASGLSNPALDKFLAAVGGWAGAGTRVRWPFRSAPSSAVDDARRHAHELIPELFPPAHG